MTTLEKSGLLGGSIGGDPLACFQGLGSHRGLSTMPPIPKSDPNPKLTKAFSNSMQLGGVGWGCVGAAQDPGIEAEG